MKIIQRTRESVALFGESTVADCAERYAYCPADVNKNSKVVPGSRRGVIRRIYAMVNEASNISGNRELRYPYRNDEAHNQPNPNQS
jgi:hypothetical protein